MLIMSKYQSFFRYIYTKYIKGNKMLTKRIKSLNESITIAISTLAAQLKAEGKDVLSFSAGEPDFSTPQVIKDEAKKAIDDRREFYKIYSGAGYS